MKKIDIADAPSSKGTNYPPPHCEPCLGRARQRVGEAGGLTQFGVNRLTLPPGAWSSQRHWHTHEDEFVWVVEGEVVLVTNAGEEILGPGDCAAFKAGDADGHHLINRSDTDAVLLEVGGRDMARDACDYPDIDMIARPGEDFYRQRDGKAYAKAER